jgi:hypothetical protein
MPTPVHTSVDAAGRSACATIYHRTGSSFGAATWITASATKYARLAITNIGT